MPVVSFLLNVLWVVTGGVWMALAWILAAVLMAITIVGLPWARAALTIAGYTFLPLGYMVAAVALAITLLGLPFAWAHLKLAGIALWPIGRVVVPVDAPLGAPR